MSTVVRTNWSVNSSVHATLGNWLAVAGTGGTASSARTVGPGFDGIDKFFRATWSVASTAVGGGAQSTHTGLSASTQYTHSVYVRPSKTQTVRLTAQYQNSTPANVGTAVNGTAVSCPAGVWTRLSVTATSGLAVDRVILSALVTAGSTWAVGDTFDMDGVLIETGSLLKNYFDGTYVGGLGHVYGWTGTAFSSTSTDTLYDPVLTLTAKTDAPCARVDVTITDLPPTSNRVNLWRIADGVRRRVRSYSNVEIIGSDVTTDFEAPLNRSLTYEIEVLSGIGMGGPSGTGTVTVTTPDGCGYIQDPLNPESAIKVFAVAGPNGEPTLMTSAVASLTYHMDGELVPILGSPEPVALLGQRMIASAVPFDMFTDAAQQTTNFRNLLLGSSIVLVRPGADWGSSLPGLCYIAPPDPQELPIGVTFGAEYTEWKFTASLIAAPELSIVIPFWTYQDWAALWTTYQSTQTTMAGKTYLAVRRSPTNGV